VDHLLVHEPRKSAVEGRPDGCHERPPLTSSADRHEVVASDMPGEGATLGGGGRQRIARRADHPVGDGEAEAVVEGLEIIEIEIAE
jgi:hypothetical protein